MSMEVNRSVLLPSLLTICNGACGFMAIVLLRKIPGPGAPVPDGVDVTQILASAAWLVFVGMVFDVFDGKVARVSGGSSALGAQLDSLCDLITFGLVPAFMIIQMSHAASPTWGRIVTIFSLAYFVGATLRLARFTAENSPDESSHMAFKGLPTPGAAGCIASLSIFYAYLSSFDKPELRWLASHTGEVGIQRIVDSVPVVLPVLALFLGFTMVSNRLVYGHAGSWFFARKHSFDLFAYLIFAAVLACVVPEVVLPIVFLSYVCYSPVAFCIRAAMGRAGQSKQPNDASPTDQEGVSRRRLTRHSSPTEGRNGAREESAREESAREESGREEN